MTKRCAKCGEEKPLDAFQKRKDRPGGLGVRSRCKECVREPARRRAAKWWAEKGDEANTKRRQERVENPGPIRAREREAARRRRQSPERQEYERQWRNANPDAVKAIMARHLSKYPRWSRPDDPEAAAYIQILLRDPCAICGARPVEIDHIDPVAKGGGSEWGNLAPLCRTCNASKNARPLLVALAEGIAASPEL